MNKKILGIIGGIGTAATDNFCSLLTASTPANTDQEHLERILHNNPHIPDRTTEIEKIMMGSTPICDSFVVKELVRSFRLLYNAGAQTYAIPCNTIHYFLPEALKQISFGDKINIIHIVEEVAKYCKINGLHKVGLLSTRGTAVAAIYPKICQKYNVEVVMPSTINIDNIMDAIYGQRDGYSNGLGVKNAVRYHQSPRNKKLLITVIKELVSQKLNGLILGCTEISMCVCSDDLIENNLPVLPMLDTTELLAKACIRSLY